MKNNVFGFTIIELIVAVTVIMVLVGVGSISLNNFNSIKELETIREQVSTQIKLARNLAVTRQLSEETDTKYLEFVKVSLDNNSIKAEGVDNLGEVDNSFPYFTTVVNTNSEIVITLKDSFGFMRSSGRLTDSGGNLVGTTMSVFVNQGTNQKVININSLGVVSNVN